MLELLFVFLFETVKVVADVFFSKLMPMPGANPTIFEFTTTTPAL
jgi:hypothetical protein